MTNLDPSLTTPIASDPVNDPGNWREIDRLRRLAEAEGRTFDPGDPYNWKGISAMPTGSVVGSSTDLTATSATAPTPATSTAGEDAARNKQLFANMSQILNEAGLSDLFTIGADGTPGGWLWDQVTNGLDSTDALQLQFEQTPQFQARYPVITQLRQGIAGGAPGQVPTPAQVREFEQRSSAAMRQAGIPTWFYDTPQELQSMMAKGMSAVEVEQRLGQSWERVQNTDPAVRDAFAEFYGIDGDGALAAAFLDPATTLAKLDQMSRTAYTKGMGQTFGINIDRATAERVAGLPKTDAGLITDLENVNALRRDGGTLFEGITETKNLTDQTAIDATMFGDGNAQADIERRVLERQANARSSAGGAALTNRGLTGVGNA